MANYAITRIKKYSNVGSASYLLNHHLRGVPVANADPSRKHKNVVLHKQEGNLMDFLNEVPAGSKRNACRFVDVIFTASKFNSKQHADEWAKTTLAFAQKEFGADNIALAVVHRDETTDHLHLIFKPVNPKTGKLGAGHWFDGKLKMKAYQDRYHKAVAHLGFDRGDPAKRAHHKTIKQYYSEMAKAEQSYKDYHHSLVDLYNEVQKVSLWDRLNPMKLQAKLKPLFAKVDSKAKKVMMAKELLQVDKTNQKNKQLLDQVDHLQMKLEKLTGSPNPDLATMDRLAPLFKIQQASSLQKIPGGETSPDPSPSIESPQAKKKRKWF